MWEAHSESSQQHDATFQRKTHQDKTIGVSGPCVGVVNLAPPIGVVVDLATAICVVNLASPVGVVPPLVDVVNLASPVGVVGPAPAVGVVNLTSQVGMVDLAPPVSVVTLAPPVSVVTLAPPVSVVTLAPPVGIVNLASPLCVLYLTSPVGMVDLTLLVSMMDPSDLTSWALFLTTAPCEGQQENFEVLILNETTKETKRALCHRCAGAGNTCLSQVTCAVLDSYVIELKPVMMCYTKSRSGTVHPEVNFPRCTPVK